MYHILIPPVGLPEPYMYLTEPEKEDRPTTGMQGVTW